MDEVISTHRCPRPSQAGGTVACALLTEDQTAAAGKVGYSTPETYWTTRTTWQE